MRFWADISWRFKKEVGVAISKRAYQLAAIQRTEAGTMRVRFIYLFISFHFFFRKVKLYVFPRRHSDNPWAAFRYKVKWLFASFTAQLHFSPSLQNFSFLFFFGLFFALNMCGGRVFGTERFVFTPPVSESFWQTSERSCTEGRDHCGYANNRGHNPSVNDIKLIFWVEGQFFWENTHKNLFFVLSLSECLNVWVL